MLMLVAAIVWKERYKTRYINICFCIGGLSVISKVAQQNVKSTGPNERRRKCGNLQAHASWEVDAANYCELEDGEANLGRGLALLRKAVKWAF